MKILILEDSSQNNFGGGQKVTLQVANVLYKSSELIFSDFTETSIYFKETRKSFPISKFVTLSGKRIKVGNKIVKNILNLIFTISYLFVNTITLKKIVNINDVSIVYATTRLTLIYAFVLYKLTGVNYIYHAHLVNSTSLFNCIWTHLASRAHKVLCVSKTVQNSFSVTNKILLYNPNLNNRGCKREKTNNHFVVSSIGSLIPIKGFIYLINAAMFLPYVEFRIYGVGELETLLKEKAPSNVKFMGFCNDIISELYNSIDIVVVPTIIQEALPLVIVESKSVGIPVICTNLGGQAEIIDDDVNGFKVPIMDSQAIAEKIALLTSDLERYKTMSRASFESLYCFDYNNFVKIVNESFSEADLCKINE